MDGEEESSWLSILIDRVDKLALSIGGYEDEAPEQIFSDDESDNASSSEDDERSGDSGFEDAESNGDDPDGDSGFEDAIASPGRPPFGRPRVEKSVEAPKAKGGESGARGKAVADVRRGFSFERLPPVSSADKAPSVFVPTSHRSSDHPNLTDAQASDEAFRGGPTRGHREQLAVPTAFTADKGPSFSVTHSHSQDHLDEANITAAERAPLEQGSAGAAFISTFSTPAHSRHRDTSIRPPPLEVAPAGSGAGRRRVRRERHRNGEDLDASSTEGMPYAEEPAPVHAPPPSNASPPLEAVNRPHGSTKMKKYSYVSDNTWLKPKEDFPEPVPSPLELGTVGVRGECSPIQRNTHSTSGSSRVHIVGTAEGASTFAARGDRHGFPSEAEQQLEQEVPAEVVAKADTGAQDAHVQRLSGEASDKSAEDPEIHEDRGAETEANGSARPEDSLLLEESSEDKMGANGHNKPHAENGTIQVVGGERRDEDCLEEAHGEGDERRQEKRTQREKAGEDAVEPVDVWTDEEVMVGAKRASIGKDRGAQELDLILDSPEGVATSKRGKTQPEHPLAVMRHSSRLDDAIHERQRKLGATAIGSGSESSENGEGDELAAIPWTDRALRPYDSPIVDTELPARQAKELSRLGMGSETLILCSPFRRCLQTAGVVARTLGVAGVTVHLEVGERMDKVRKEIAELALTNEQESDGPLGSKGIPVFSYLGEEAMREALGAGVELERIVGERPSQEESGIEAKQRFIATIAKVREEKLRESPVLVVAHGDTLDAAGESLAAQIVFEADYCAWALFELDSHCGGHVTESYGIQMIPL